MKIVLSTNSKIAETHAGQMRAIRIKRLAMFPGENSDSFNRDQWLGRAYKKDV